jgi:hypothetical protein
LVITPLSHLAVALNRRDEVPNVELAEQIAAKGDRVAVQVLVDALASKHKGVPEDSIKALYEIGMRRPTLLVRHLDAFVPHLRSKNGRMVWGAMHAIHQVARIQPSIVEPYLPRILKIADGDSVIARDHAVGILIAVASDECHQSVAFALLDLLDRSPDNQFPSYAEKGAKVLARADINGFREVLVRRLALMPPSTKAKRVAAVLKKLSA